MKSSDDIRSVADLLEAAGKAIESAGSQDESVLDLGKLALGALHWATDTPSRYGRRFEDLLTQYERELKRLSPRPTSKSRKLEPAAAKATGDPW
jgi:hypothetical protein